MNNKICTGCHIAKPLNAFANRKRNKDGKQSRCKDCHAIYYKNNKERILTYGKNHREQNNATARARYLKSRWSGEMDEQVFIPISFNPVLFSENDTYYTVYKITNISNGFIYIGKHKTKNLNDGYFGSGSRLTNAIKKHGKENFTKEILFIFKSEEEMNNKEKEIVTPAFLQRKDVYNLCVGGVPNAPYSHYVYPKSHHSRKHPEAVAAMRKKNSQSWRVTFENGSYVELTNLKRWSKENGYNPSHLNGISRKERKRHKNVVNVEKISPQS